MYYRLRLKEIDTKLSADNNVILCENAEYENVCHYDFKVKLQLNTSWNAYKMN